MKFLKSIYLHAILLAVTVGLAQACFETNQSLMISYPINGLAVGLGLTLMIRMFV